MPEQLRSLVPLVREIRALGLPKLVEDAPAAVDAESAVGPGADGVVVHQSHLLNIFAFLLAPPFALNFHASCTSTQRPNLIRGHVGADDAPHHRCPRTRPAPAGTSATRLAHQRARRTPRDRAGARARVGECLRWVVSVLSSDLLAACHLGQCKGVTCRASNALARDPTVRDWLYFLGTTGYSQSRGRREKRQSRREPGAFEPHGATTTKGRGKAT